MAEKDYGKFRVINFLDEKAKRHKAHRKIIKQWDKFNKKNKGAAKLKLAKESY